MRFPLSAGAWLRDQIFGQQGSEHLRLAIHLATVAAPVGLLVGCAIAAYDYLVNTVLWEHFTGTFAAPLLCALPFVGMMLTWLVLTLFKIDSSAMADEVVRAYHQPEVGMNYRQALGKLTASVATMGFGASAGMEGASKWLGGSIGGFVQQQLNKQKWFKFLHGRVEITLLAGAAAGIAAIFRAPLTGAIMGIESPYKHDLAHEALLHGLVAAAMSYITFCLFRSATPYFPLHVSYVIRVRDVLLCLPLGLAAGLSSHLFLALLMKLKRFCRSKVLPRFVCYLIGGLLLSAMAYAVLLLMGEPATLQAGLPVANRLLNGHYTLAVCLLIFVAKLLATAITFGMGGVGGLFVPSATIGAALGAMLDGLLPASQPGLFTLVGIAAFTGASYNSLLFAAVFVAEATGSPALVVPGLVASTVAFVTAAGVSNSEHQRLVRAGDSH